METDEILLLGLLLVGVYAVTKKPAAATPPAAGAAPGAGNWLNTVSTGVGNLFHSGGGTGSGGTAGTAAPNPGGSGIDLAGGGSDDSGDVDLSGLDDSGGDELA